MNLFRRFILILLIIFIFDYNKDLPIYQLPKLATQKETNDFLKMIEKISTEADVYNDPWELDTSKVFRLIYENPSYYLAPAIALMEQKNVSSNYKMIIGHCMQNLPPEQFVKFINVTVDSIEQNKTELKVIYRLYVIHRELGKRTLVMFYDDLSVQVLLKRILKLSLSLEHKDFIQSILTGQAKKEYLNYMDEIGHPIVFGIQLDLEKYQ